jgi:hypothetical protein
VTITIERKTRYPHLVTLPRLRPIALSPHYERRALPSLAMYRSHVRYARICFGGCPKKSLIWTLLVNLPPMGSECSSSLLFTGRHPDSSSRHGSFREHQSPPHRSVVQSSRMLPLALQRRLLAHMFSGSLAGSPVLVCGAGCGILPCPEILLFGVYLCVRGQARGEAKLLQRWISHDRWQVVARASDSSFFSTHCCNMSRAAPDGRRP